MVSKEDYQKALENFQSALVAKPDDEYASLKLKEIRETLASLEEEGDQLPEGMIDDNGIYNFTEEPPVLVGGRDGVFALNLPPGADLSSISMYLRGNEHPRPPGRRYSSLYGYQPARPRHLRL